MKSILRLISKIVILSTALLTVNDSISQITAPTATNTVSTAYTLTPAIPNDNIYIFCLPNQSTTDIASLTASAPSGTGPWTYEWRQYNSTTWSFDAYSSFTGTTSTINNLASGGYFVSVTDNGGVNVGCYIAWVFNNETNVDIAAIAPGCGSFQLNGTADPIADFVYYNPPEEPSMVIDATTTITVCFDATHTYNSDLGFYLISPTGQTVVLSENPGGYDPANNICNGIPDVNNLCFTTAANPKFNPCGGITYTGTFDSYGTAGFNFPIDWSPLYGEDAAKTGWQVQVYDCVGGDVGTLDRAEITFDGDGACGLSIVEYKSGAISSAINDNSCDPASASIFTVPPLPIYTTPITLTNTITNFQWTSDNPCVTIPNATTSLTPTINPVPDTDTWFYLTASDDLGCPIFIDSTQFINTCPCPITNLTSNILPCNSGPGTFDITGQITFSNAPCTGQLTVTNCSGDQQVFNAPFVSPINYNITGITADSTVGCIITANFTNDPAACTGFSTAAYVEPTAPTTASATINRCDDGTGNATFDLTSVDATVNAGTANVVTWFTDPATTIPIASPATFTSGTTTVYASVSDGNCSDTASVFLVVDPLPTTNSTTMSLCDDGTGNATFNLTSVNATVNGGNANTVSWFSNPATTIAIANPTAFLSGPTTVYASVSDGTCSDTASVFLTINAVGAAVQTTISLCDDGTGNATFDLTAADATVNAGTANIVSWFSDPATTIAIPTPNNFLSGSTTVYASVANGTCIDTASVFLVVNAVPTAIDQNPTTLCEDISGGGAVANIDLTALNTAIDGGTGTTISWFSDPTASTAVVNPTNATVSNNQLFYALVHNGNCFDTATVTYTVIALPNANAGVDDTVCALTYNLNATASVGTGTWSSLTPGVVFGNAASPTSSVTVPAAGIHTFTWSEDNTNGCTDADNVDITFNILSVPNTLTNPTCFGSTNGQIILAPQSSGGATTHSYQWDAAANNQITNPASNLTAGAFTVRVTDGFGCFVDSTFTLTQPQDFTFTTDSSNSNCGLPDGWATVVNFAGGTGPYTYDWGAGPTTNDSLLNLIPGVYTVTVTDAVLPVGCDTSFSITVGNNPAFSASITNPVNVSCNGFTDGTATANGSDPLVAYTYLWDGAANNQTTQTATNLGAGSYLVTVTDPNTGCTDTTSVTLTQPTMVTVVANPINICLGQTANLTATGANGNGAPYSYDWDNGAFIGSPYNVTPGVTTTYAVFAMDVDGCPSLPINVDVIVSQPLTVTVDLDQSICLGESTSFSALATPGSGNGGPYTYSWDNGLPNGANQNISPIVTTTYTVTLDDGCTTPVATAQITVTVNPLPIVDFTVDDQNACEGTNQLFTFNNVPGATDSILTWSFGDGSTSSGLGTNFNPNAGSVTHSYPATSGVYNVTLDVITTDAAGQCASSLTKTAYITIFENPVADFTMDPNPTTMFDPTINFYDASTTNALNINSWAWNIAGLDSSSLQNPSHTFPQDTGNYLVTLTVVDDNGCSSNVTHTAIVTGEYGIFVPNAFTPDGDGLNDEFFPDGFGVGNEDFSFFIFNRWGEILYETHTRFSPWNGKFKGNNVPNGTYVWRLDFKDINGKQHKEVGKVNLIR